MHPISEEEFSGYMRLFGKFPSDKPQYPIAIAVSGGADSLCLAFLLRRWRQAVHGLIVDHGLRANSAEEAEQTARTLAHLDIPSTILKLSLSPDRSRLQERARIARYETLAEYCSHNGILDLCLGHHAMDQLETFLLRERKGSYAYGLASMALSYETPHLRMIRPLLSCHPQRLRATLAQHGINWSEDPSNENPQFERVRIRQDLGGEVPELQAAQIQAYGRMRNGYQQRLAHVSTRVRLDRLGYAYLPPELIDPISLGRMWRLIGRSRYAPTVSKLEALINKPAPACFSGAMLTPAGKWGPGWLLLREPQVVQGHIPLKNGTRWDNAWQISTDSFREELLVGPLGSSASSYRYNRHPFRVLAGLPAIWRANKIVGIPCLDEKVNIDGSQIEMHWRPASLFTDGSYWMSNVPNI